MSNKRKHREEAGNSNPLHFRWGVSWLRVLIIAGCLLILLIPIFTIMAPKTSLITLGRVLHKVMSNPETIIPAKSLQIVHSGRATGPLRVDPGNPRYFTDGSGRAIYLTGSHTWDNRQDMGSHVFDYSEYLTLLSQWNHNFLRLWVWEQPKGITTSPDPAEPLATLKPELFARTGPGTAADGGLKFDVTKYNQAHFDRLRQRIVDAGNHGIYVSVMLFDGWSVEQKGGGANPWIYHPFNKNNNINGIDGDPNKDQSGRETHTLQISKVTQVQEAYIRKVIDTVNDLDNVLYEICNECDTSTDWQNHMIDYIHTYEATKAKQHPVGFTATSNPNSILLGSNAEWISPNGSDGYSSDPPVNNGTKVIVLDNDHIFGIGGSVNWYWKGFTRGLNLLYMDVWDGHFIPGTGSQEIRDNLGYILSYANRMNLAAMTPRPDLCSTGYCLANPAANGAEYLVYLPAGGGVTVNLSGASGQLSTEWLNPSTGTTTAGGTTNGGAKRSFAAPFSGDAVLYIYQ
jgi:hypothetical protein